MTGLTLLAQDTFTSDGNGRRIDLPGGADYFVVLDQTEAAATNDVSFKFEWFPNLNDSEAFETNKTGGGNDIQYDLVTTSGFIYRASTPEPEAALAVTAITAANPAVATSASHGYGIGDKVRFSNMTDMDQIAGIEFEITAVTANTFTLGFLDASGFAAAETSASVRRYPQEIEVLPGARFITSISQAASAVVEFSVLHQYKVGDVLYFRVPSDFGMVEMDKLQGKVTAIDITTANTSTVTVDIDSTGFTAFAFPADGNLPFSLPLAGLAGKRGLYDNWFSATRQLLDLDPFRTGLDVPYMWLPGGQGNPGGANGNVMTWQAWRKGN